MALEADVDILGEADIPVPVFKFQISAAGMHDQHNLRILQQLNKTRPVINDQRIAGWNSV